MQERRARQKTLPHDRFLHYMCTDCIQLSNGALSCAAQRRQPRTHADWLDPDWQASVFLLFPVCSRNSYVKFYHTRCSKIVSRIPKRGRRWRVLPSLGKGKGKPDFSYFSFACTKKKPNVCSSNFMMRIIFAICIVIIIGPYCTADGGPKSKR